MKTTKLSPTDKLVRRMTAFRSWAEMLGCLKGGYVPTLRRTAANNKLARVVEGHGFRTFRIN